MCYHWPACVIIQPVCVVYIIHPALCCLFSANNFIWAITTIITLPRSKINSRGFWGGMLAWNEKGNLQKPKLMFFITKESKSFMKALPKHSNVRGNMAALQRLEVFSAHFWKWLQHVFHKKTMLIDFSLFWEAGGKVEVPVDGGASGMSPPSL